MKNLHDTLVCVAALALLVGVLSSCEMLVARAASDFSLSVEPQTLELRRGESAQVKVVISRPVDLAPLPVNVRLDDPPSGVTAAPVAIEAGDNDGVLELQVDAAAPLGEVTLEIFGSNSLAAQTAELSLTVLEPLAGRGRTANR